MAKNYLNLDEMSRHLPQALKPKSDQPHSLLSDEDNMDEDVLLATSNRPSGNGTNFQPTGPCHDNFFLAKLKQAKAGGVKALITLTNLLNLGGGDKNANPASTENSLKPMPIIRESRSLHDLPKMNDGPASSLPEKSNSWVELRDMDSGSKYCPF